MIRELIKPTEPQLPDGWLWRVLRRPETYLIVLGVALAFGIAILPSRLGFLTLGMDANTRSSLASALIGGVVIGFALLGAERALGAQLAGLEQRRAEQSAKQALRLQLSLLTDQRHIDLRNTDLSGFYLPERTYQRAMLFGAKLTDANLRDADLSGSSLWHATLHRTNLVRANLTDAELVHARGTGTVMRSARLRSAKLNSAMLRGANLSGADLSDAWLVDTDLSRADLSRAVVDGARFMGTRLDQAILSSVDLSNVAQWKDVTIEGVSWNNATVWPDGVEAPPPRVTLRVEPAPTLGEPPVPPAKV